MAMASGNVSAPKSKDAALLTLMERTGYTIVQENGQRKFGPPPDWQGPSPPKGSEVFVGKIPRDLYEDELVPVFEKIGKIYEVRLMMDFSGSNRGYAFVMYTSTVDAKRAVKDLDNYEIRKGRFIGVCKSVDNCRLFVGGIPKTKTKEEILSEMKKVTEGVVDVILYSSVIDKTKNRGFAFAEYENHRAAAMARRKLIPGKIQLWGHEIAVDWAEPEPEVDEDTMAKVTVLYVRNLMTATTEDKLKDIFTLGNTLKVEKVKKLKDFAFVHYHSRDEAEKALKTLHNTVLEETVIEVTWAKPVDRSIRQRTRSGTNQTVNNYTPFLYSPSLDPFNYGPSFSFPQPSGRGSVVHRVLVRSRGRGAAGLRGVRGCMVGPPRVAAGYCKPFEHHIIDMQPNMELFPTNLYTMKLPCRPYQVLVEICQKNNWGEPQFQLHTVFHADGGGENTPLYFYKVMIPALCQQYQSSKLCNNVEDARQSAAEYVLIQLGVPPEGVEAPLALAGPGLAAAYSPHGRLGLNLIPTAGFDPAYYDAIPPMF